VKFLFTVIYSASFGFVLGSIYLEAALPDWTLVPIWVATGVNGWYATDIVSFAWPKERRQ
jgi:hypothetical protein